MLAQRAGPPPDLGAKTWVARSASDTPGAHTVTLALLASYVHQQIHGKIADIEKQLYDAAMALEYEVRGPSTEVQLDDGKMFIEDCGAWPGELEHYLSNIDPIGQTASEDDVGSIDVQKEYAAFPKERDLIELARRQGARIVQPKAYSVRVVTPCGARINLSPTTKTESNLLRKRKLEQMWAAGIRPSRDSLDSRWCTVCLGFQGNDAVTSCHSGVPSCLKQQGA